MSILNDGSQWIGRSIPTMSELFPDLSGGQPSILPLTSRRQPPYVRPHLPHFDVEARFTTLSETIDWGMAAYGIPNAWKLTQGRGIRVAVLDTGCQIDHPDLAGAIVASKDFTGSRVGANDKNGHGTHCAGVIAARRNNLGVVGVGPEISLLIGKVLGDDGSGLEEWIIQGIEWAVMQGADVLSMSFGGRGMSAGVKNIIAYAIQKGRFIIAAAGNDGTDNSVNEPASFENTVAVAAVDRAGRVAKFSSRGPQVDIAAPGQDVLSTWLGAGYAKLSGTSMATPFVAGVVALTLARHRELGGGRTPIKTHDDLVAHLQTHAKDAGPQGKDPAYGYGLINPESMLEAGDVQPPPPPPPPPPPVDGEIKVGPVEVNGKRGAFVFVPE